MAHHPDDHSSYPLHWLLADHDPPVAVDRGDALMKCPGCYPFDCDDPDRHLGIPEKYKTPGCHCGADIDGRDCMCFEGES